MREASIVLGLVLVAGCADIVEEAPPLGNVVGSPAVVVLTVGETVWVDSLLQLSFTDVPGDSRCPSSVYCFWAGDGAVAIATGIGRTMSVPDTLHTTLEPRAVDFAGYRIALLELMPYPAVPGPIPLDEYAARFEIVRLVR